MFHLPQTARRLLSAAACALLAPMAAQATLMPPSGAVPVALANAGFEAAWTGLTFSGDDGSVTFNYQPTGIGLGWNFGGGTGVVTPYPSTPLSPYADEHMAFLQNATDALSQTFTLNSAASVLLNFALALRPGYNDGQVVRVSVDNQMRAEIAATDTQWSLQAVLLGPLSAGDHTLQFQGLTGTGDTTAYLDAVALTATPTTGGNVPEPQSLALVLTALAGAVALRRRKA